MKLNTIWKLIISVGVSQLAGVVGSVFAIRAIPTWYADLVKPTFNPPAWVFGPVLTVLYLLMGVAVFLVWGRGLAMPGVKRALIWFDAQLILNALWSIIFFGLHSPGAALIEIIVLWVAILATIIEFAKVSKPAAWLLPPYILWVTFAGYLNYSFWVLN